MTTLERIAGLVEQVTGSPAKDIGPAVTFVDVSTDSFEHVEIILEIERAFAIDLDDPALDLVRTMGELADLVDRLLAAKKARAA